MTREMGFTTSKLGNGIHIATDRMASVESVTLGVWVGSGSRHERADDNGAAHFLEHMVFKGTKSRNAKQIAAEVEASGGALNAWTSRECTAYHARLPADKWRCGLDIVTDLIANHTLDEAELKREKGVILQEIGMSNDTPGDVAFDAFYATAYPAQAVGRPVLGTAAIIGALGRADLDDFAKKNYLPHRMVVAAAGKIDHERLAKGVEERLGAMNGGGDGSEPQSANYKGGSSFLAKRLEQTHLVMGMSSPHYRHELYFPLLVFSAALGGGMASRLFQEIREKRGLVYSVHTFFSPYVDSGLFGIYAGTSKDKVKELISAAAREFASLGQSPHDEELERAKSMLYGGILLSLESTAVRADRLAQQLIFYGRHYPPEELIERIRAVTAADIALVADFLLASPVTLVVSGPQPKGLQESLKSGPSFPLAA